MLKISSFLYISMTTYSFSQVSTYCQCPRKYQFHYLDRLKTKVFETTYELLLGSLVHLSLQWRYQQIFPEKHHLFSASNIPTKSALLEFFDHHRKKETKNTSSIRGSEDFTPQEIKTRAEKYLSDYHDTHQNFEHIENIETEKEMLFILPNSQSFKGVIDRIDFLKDGTIIINDYKTGKKLPITSDTGYIDQLSLYAYAIQKKYPQAKQIKAKIIYLHFGIEDERKIKDEDLNILIQKYQTYTSEIELKRQTYFQTKAPLPVQENSFCNYCEYQSSCPLRRHSFLTPETISEQWCKS